jgi:hypothetical protein
VGLVIERERLKNEKDGLRYEYTLGYNDYDVILENDRVSQIYRCKKLFKDTFVKYVFQNFEPFLANRALKFKKVLI